MGSTAPPTPEKDIIGKWCACIYVLPRKQLVYIGKILKRFLKDENGPVLNLEVNCCLKEKIRSPGLYETVPEHLPDITVFKASHVISFATVIPLEKGKWEVSNIDEIKLNFNKIVKKKIDLKVIYEELQSTFWFFSLVKLLFCVLFVILFCIYLCNISNSLCLYNVCIFYCKSKLKKGSSR